MEGHAQSHYIGIGIGKTFIEACEKFIKRTGRDEICLDENGNKYACDCGCCLKLCI